MKKNLLSLFSLLALGSGAALAQTAPPVLNNPPVAPVPAAAPAAAVGAPAAAPAVADPFLLGRTYRVETVQGTTFTGVLVSMSLTALEFDAKELGHLTLERAQIRRADLQGPIPPTTKAGYYDIGNGNRLFFAPTGRGLRKNEASLQDVDVYLLGINYGITDNISLGGYMSIIPGLSLDQQLLVFTPKISYPIRDNLNVGFGLLYVRVPNFDSQGTGTGAGIGYGALTYGGADNNFTVGLGYGFVQGNIGSTPILQVGGQRRVSRRISLLSENYIVADANAGMGGLYGLKINWRRTSLGLGAVYYYEFGHDEQRANYYYNPNNGQYTTTYQTVRVPGQGFSSYVIPLYIDFTFRFGKGVK
ncbi:hypothetical protein MON38_11330 [Hymenobacter sp. DH14]|uniref:Outer membrane protein beta-barrel domain-containing protein n=1 Tax=Hymenobacter cyanobacteriorum TaxID=2926463 RepID=A0A9X1VH05_9BACT|nr:hypothetical protein [Hymenobacter cyanobacteriorum]MCI1188013.1 hypothetical protein [Hymenobacter cyanobacteriorum]